MNRHRKCQKVIKRPIKTQQCFHHNSKLLLSAISRAHQDFKGEIQTRFNKHESKISTNELNIQALVVSQEKNQSAIYWHKIQIMSVKNLVIELLHLIELLFLRETYPYQLRMISFFVFKHTM